ncbi:hypothetical protein RUM44_012323 [Polyplax serrata]|uniref:Uncharacterized protein n=1 Tax=Polyplax serrata TaxID=468196 RepID=A0ABR1BBB7_POLSC
MQAFRNFINNNPEAIENALDRSFRPSSSARTRGEQELLLKFVKKGTERLREREKREKTQEKGQRDDFLNFISSVCVSPLPKGAAAAPAAAATVVLASVNITAGRKKKCCKPPTDFSVFVSFITKHKITSDETIKVLPLKLEMLVTTKKD